MQVVNTSLADNKADRYLAIAEGLLVTMIVGSTLVFVKMVFAYWGPLTISGLRYVLAFMLLFHFLVSFVFFFWSLSLDKSQETGFLSSDHRFWHVARCFFIVVVAP
jgi:hypothetical protein